MTSADLSAIEQSILAVDGVASLHGGPHGAIATYRPGRRVTGVRLDAELAHVHLAVYEGHDLTAVADRVRSAVALSLTRDAKSVVITIEDLVPRPTPASTDQESS